MTIIRYSAAHDPLLFAQQFSTLPERVRALPYQKSILPSSVRQTLLNMPYPAPNEFWLALAKHVPVACIGATVSALDPSIGYIGFIECADSPEGNQGLLNLIGQACQFLKEQGCYRAIGPIQYNTWFPYRYRCDYSDNRFFGWAPSNPPVYVDLILKAGFSKGETYHSTAFDNLDDFLAKTQPAYNIALKNGFRFRPFDLTSWETKEIPMLYRITHAAFKDNYLFEPISLAHFQQLYVQVSNKQNKFAYIAISPEGQEVGYCFAFEDVAHPVDKEPERYAVLKTMAIHPDARGSGLSNALIYLSVRDCTRAGISRAIAAMIRAGIQSESYARKGSFLWRHEYFLFEKKL